MSTSATIVQATRDDRQAAKKSPWIIGPWFDSLFFTLSPVLALVLGIVISGADLPQRSFMLGNYSNTFANSFIGTFIFAHLFIVFFRSHLNGAIFRTHPLRFTVVPVVLWMAMNFSPWTAVSVAVLATWWDVYHSSLQTFGIGRIYDMKLGNDPTVGRQLDRWINLLLYAGPILAGATLMDHVEDFEDFDEVGSIFFSSIPVLVESNRQYFTWTILGLGLPFLGYYVFAYWRLQQKGYRVSPQKVLLLVSTGLVSIYTWGFNTFGEAFFIMNFFHAWQYFALVWWSERKNLVSVAHVQNVSWGMPLIFVIFLSVGLGYGLWAEMLNTNSAVFFNLAIVVSIMHFWYDGFIWSVRKKQESRHRAPRLGCPCHGLCLSRWVENFMIASKVSNGPSSAGILLVPQLILVLTILVTPWCYGGIHESTQVFVLLAMLCAGIGWLLASFFPGSGSRPAVLPLAMLPLVAGVLFGLFQLLPLPRSVAGLIAPQTADLREQLVSDDIYPETADADGVPTPTSIRHTISLRPAATRHDLLLLTLGLAGFYLASQLFHSPRAYLALCMAVAANGAIFTVFGLIQRLTWNGRVYWIGGRAGGMSFGAFVNRNNAGGYLNLCLAAAVALLVFAANAKQADGESERNERSSRHPTYQSSARERITRSFAEMDAWQLLAGCLAAVLMGGILCTLSRGAGIGMLFASAVTALVVMLTGQREKRLGGIWVALAAGLGLVAWVGLHDALVARAGTLAEGEQLVESGRVPNWTDALHSVPDFWRTGSGLGTYRDIYLLYQQRFDPTWYYHAENQYVQALVEGGLPALLLLLAEIGLVALAVRSLIRSPDPRDYAFAVGGVFVLASQMVCGFLDFGLNLPANLLLMAVLCGALAGRAASIAESGTKSAWLAFPLPAMARPVFGSLLVLGLLLAVWQIRSIAATELALLDAEYSTLPGDPTEQYLRDLVAKLESRLDGSSDDPELHYQLGRARTYLHRVLKVEELRRTTPVSVSFNELWQRASTATLHARVQELARAGDAQQLESVRGEPLVKEHLLPAWRHLLLSRQACPILAKTHLRLAKLCFLQCPPECDAAHVNRARLTAPSDLYTLIESGLLDLQAGRIDDACQSWRRCLELSDEDAEFIVDYAQPALALPVVVEKILPASPSLLLRLARDKFADDDESQRVLLDRAGQLAEGADLPEDQRHYFRAAVYAESGDHAAALGEYQQAVSLQPREINWRYEYGKLLFQEGQYDQAREQLRWCARNAPNSAEYRRLLEEIIKAKSRG